ncbi:hypothetical protein C8R43DRAFT_1231165 [Mycena crocata]|nr:hypothetical protein C8R43DRAFT_1231165 [Mycena crocata]
MLSELQVYTNPFEDEPIFREESGVVITGSQESVGKTTFLKYIFHLRAAANLPTIYIDSQMSTTMFKNGETAKLNNVLQTAMEQNLPPSTWALAASPNSERFAAAVKLEDRAQICIMKPWTPWELVVGQTLRPASCQIASERQLLEFHEMLGGFPRHAFEAAHDLDGFRDKSMQSTMTGEELRRIIFHTPLNLDNDLAHMLLSVFPLTDTDRQAFRIAPPARTMYDMQFYDRCFKAGTPGSKAMAGEVLATHFHSLLVAFGVWELRRSEGTLEGNPNARTRTYIVPNRSCNRMLSANGTMQIADWSPAPEYAPLTEQIWNLRTPPTATQLEEVEVNFRPLRWSFPGADASYILEPGHALLFQTPGKAAPHGFTGEAVRWFAERGIGKFTYVYMTPDFTGLQVLLPHDLIVTSWPCYFIVAFFYHLH